MARRLDFGIASYRKTDKLIRTFSCLINNSVTDFRCFVVDCASGPETREIIADISRRDSRIVPVYLEENIGYAGAVNKILNAAETEYIGFLDDDAYVQTPGWDEKLCGYLDRFHEIGIVFPNGGAYPIQRPAYTEVMWGVGFCWILSRMAMRATGLFDDKIGHQNECDYALRLRMAGYKCATAPEVHVSHDATATNNPESIARINKGVEEFVNKWCHHFGGKNLNYHSENVLRWEDWNSLYMEQYWATKPELKGLNDNPEVVKLDGRDYDLIRVPRLSGFYRGRII